MSAPPAGMDAPKTAKRRKLTDRTLPPSLGDDFEDSKLYQDMLEVERKLDWTMSRKKMEINDAFVKVAMVRRTLRVFLSHSVEGQTWQSNEGMSLDPSSLDFSSGQGIPSWTFKVEGRLLDAPNSNSHAPRVPTRKFTSFLKGLVIEFDRDPTIYSDGNIVEWRNPNTATHPEQDGFEIKRRGDITVSARVILHLKRIPERYKLADPLTDILDMKEDTRTGIITALWHYVKVNGLQDKVDRKIIRSDAKLRPIIGDHIQFQQLPEIVNRWLKPADPVVLPYIITVDPSNPTGMQAFDIEIPMDDVALKAKMTAVHTPGDATKKIAALDEEIAIAAQSIRSSKVKLEFLQAFASDPREFVQTWLTSQSRDLDIVLGNENGVHEEDLKSSQFFTMPWVDDAVAVHEGLRIANILRAQQGTLG